MSITKLEHKVTVPTGGSDGSRRLRVVHGRQEVNLPAAEQAVRDLLLALGRDPASPHLADTPRRVAESFTEMLTPCEFDLTTFPNDAHYDELVLARSIPVQSLCEHHMLPFTGSPTLATCRANGFSACPSWPALSSCLPATSRSRSG